MRMENSFQVNIRRQTSLLVFLILFFLVVSAYTLASRWGWLPSRTDFIAFDSKGILTGPGTFLVVLSASLLALSIYSAFELAVIRNRQREAIKDAARQARVPRALAGWLPRDALNLADCPADWKTLNA